MEVAWVSTSVEGVAKSEQYEEHVDGFFFYHEGVAYHKYTPPV